MKVLVVGGGGREHAVVDALSRSPQVSKIYCAPGNAGIARQAECVPVKDTDVEGLLSLAREKEIDLTVVGPEAALVAGIVDRFREEGLRIFGPTKAAARTNLEVPSNLDIAAMLVFMDAMQSVNYAVHRANEQRLTAVEAKLDALSS